MDRVGEFLIFCFIDDFSNGYFWNFLDFTQCLCFCILVNIMFTKENKFVYMYTIMNTISYFDMFTICNTSKQKRKQIYKNVYKKYDIDEKTNLVYSNR